MTNLQLVPFSYVARSKQYSTSNLHQKGRHCPGQQTVGVEYEQRQQQQTSQRSSKGVKDRVYAPLRLGALENAIGNRRKEIARPDQYNVITPRTL